MQLLLGKPPNEYNKFSAGEHPERISCNYVGDCGDAGEGGKESPEGGGAGKRSKAAVDHAGA